MTTLEEQADDVRCCAGYLSADDCRLADLIDLVSRKTDLADYPHASMVEQNVLIYDGRGCGSSCPARRADRRLKPNWPAPCSTAPAS